jgi:RNA polymerase sigma-70 factor (sigma-E family)
VREAAEFCDYVAARRPALLRTAYHLTGDRSDAEDLLQTALTMTYLRWDQIRDRTSLDGYVRRTMVNINISTWRGRHLEEYAIGDVPDVPDTNDHATRSEIRDTLRRLLDKLPQRQRAAIMLRYFDDMSEAEIAETLGVSVGTVKSSVSRAMARLREAVQHEGTGEQSRHVEHDAGSAPDHFRDQAVRDDALPG